MRIFIAGASGVIGTRLIPLLIAEGHVVAGMTRSPHRAGLLTGLGAQPVVCDAFDADALTQALIAFGPEVVFHQLTDLPDNRGDLAASHDRNDRMRTEGTSNLLAAAAAAGPAASSRRASPGSYRAPAAVPSRPRTSVRCWGRAGW